MYNKEIGKIINEFDKTSERILKRAREYSEGSSSLYIGSEHLLLGLLCERSRACDALNLSGITLEKTEEIILSLDNSNKGLFKTTLEISPVFESIIQNAYKRAHLMGNSRVTSSELLLSLLDERESVGYEIIKRQGEPDEVREQLLSMADIYKIKKKETYQQGGREMLRKYARDLTHKARLSLIDPVLCRDKEIERLISILSRRYKNNPCLVGEAGVGKTAIVEGLAQRIADNNVPERLMNAAVFTLDMSLLLSGAKYRGEFEERLNKVIEEVMADKSIILFIDEIHTIVGAGGSEGAMDAANILKPALSRGDIRVIGATTVREYKDSIEKDPALERRFQALTVCEPTREQSLEILKGVREKYEEHHGITVTDEALSAAVELSDIYLTSRYLPDKAIDLVDESASRLSVLMSEKVLLRGHIEKTLTDITGIPILSDENDIIREKEELISRLRERVIGQDNVIYELVSSLYSPSATRALLSGSFIFYGKRGVGKTYLLKAVADNCFGGRSICFDMSEFSEQHSISKLIGAPPGYTGYDGGSRLVCRLKHEPHSLVIFENTDKAHPDIISFLTSALEGLSVSDTSGNTAGLKSALTVFTLSDDIRGSQKSPPGFFGENTDSSDADLVNIDRIMGSEFVGRVGRVLQFNDISENTALKIIENRLHDLSLGLSKKGISLVFEQSLVSYCLEKSKVQKYGYARIEKTVAELADKYILNGSSLAHGSTDESLSMSYSKEKGVFFHKN